MATIFAQGFLDTVYPKHCLRCDREGTYWCSLCKLQQVKKWNKQLNFIGERYFDELLCVADYEDEIVGELIKTCKYRFVKEITFDLAELATKQLLTSSWSGVIVPVPLSLSRERWRGFNQAAEIAKAMAEQNNFKVSNCLKRIKHKKAQAKLSEAERLVNMKDCFEVSGDVPTTVILLDDVITTGSTINECAKKLRQAGAKEIKVLALAKG